MPYCKVSYHTLLPSRRGPVKYFSLIKYILIHDLRKRRKRPPLLRSKSLESEAPIFSSSSLTSSRRSAASEGEVWGVHDILVIHLLHAFSTFFFPLLHRHSFAFGAVSGVAFGRAPGFQKLEASSSILYPREVPAFGNASLIAFWKTSIPRAHPCEHGREYEAPE